MTGDLLIRGGTVVDGTGAPARRRRPHPRRRDHRDRRRARARRRDRGRRRRCVRRARVHRLPHALRPLAVVGPARRPDAPARRDHRRHRQLLALAHAGACARPRRGQRRVRLHRGHPRRRVHQRHPVDVGVVRRVARRVARSRHRGERRRADRPLQPARLRDGRRGVDRAATPEERAQLAAVLADVAGRRRARDLDVVRRPGPPRPRGAEPRRRRRRAARAHRGARRSARPRPGAGVPALDQGARPPARRHRPGGPLVRRRRASSCTWNQLAENSRDPSPRRAHHRAGAHAPRRRLPRVRAGVAAPVQPERELRPDARRSSRSRRGGSSSPCPRPTRSGRKLADPAWRAAARADWDRVGDGFTIFPVSRLDRVRLTSVRDGEEQFLDGTLRRRRRRARRSPVRRARRLGARARPRAGHGGRGAVEQRRGQGVSELIARRHHRRRRQRRRRPPADDVRRGRLHAAAHRARARPW